MVLICITIIPLFYNFCLPTNSHSPAVKKDRRWEEPPVKRLEPGGLYWGKLVRHNHFVYDVNYTIARHDVSLNYGRVVHFYTAAGLD